MRIPISTTDFIPGREIAEVIDIARAYNKMIEALAQHQYQLKRHNEILEYEVAREGLIANLLAFNVGVEIGQLLALSAILIMMGYWRDPDATSAVLQNGWLKPALNW